MISHNKVNIFRVTLILFLFLCFLFPSTLRVERLIILVILFLIAFATVDGRIKGDGVRLTIVYITINIIFCFYGVLTGGSYAIRSLTTEVLWPAMFCVAMQPIANDSHDWNYIIKAMVYFELIVCIMDLSMIISTRFNINFGRLMTLLKNNGSFMLGNFSFLQYFSDAQKTHIFMFPFISILLLYRPNAVNRAVIITCFILSMACFLFSGRVAFYVSAIVGIIFVLIFSRRNNHKLEFGGIIKFTGVLMFIIVILLAIERVTAINYSEIITYIERKIGVGYYESDSVRPVMRKILIDGWWDSPIWGHGSGTYPASVGDYNWEARGMEDTYFLLLYRKGLIGFINLAVYYGWILFTIMKGVKRNIIDGWFAYPCIAGFISIIVANGSNPYMDNMGNMWMVFLPYAIANYVSLHNNNAEHKIHVENNKSLNYVK